ncbi:hypothetical protein BpHYR1_050011 [Brachionus plicatilis]|uniref:Uncharacterized protein n=1 Tax=Brachionus plicatilis TaxID=10195 RepID=A0A3M7QP42_BRAPC|nr:hypothetical protein BpHYR1_050011 [Brachionus plicatilis]
MKKNQNYCVLEIKNIAPSNINSLLDYFEKYYIGKLKKDSISVRAVPLFPIHIWNINDRVLHDLPRTNNSLESWHKQFEIDAKKHQTVFKVIEHFRLEQKNTDVLRIQLLSGDEYKRNSKEELKDEKIKAGLKTFSRENVIKWLNDFILLLE